VFCVTTIIFYCRCCLAKLCKAKNQLSKPNSAILYNATYDVKIFLSKCISFPLLCSKSNYLLELANLYKAITFFSEIYIYYNCVLKLLLCFRILRAFLNRIWINFLKYLILIAIFFILQVDNSNFHDEKPYPIHFLRNNFLGAYKLICRSLILVLKN